MRNAIIVNTVPYQVERNGSTEVVTQRFMVKSELEDWICRTLAGGNVVFASRIKLVHRNHIHLLSDYMMSILGGSNPSSDLMRETLKQAIKDLEVDVKELRTITPAQIIESKNSFPHNVGRLRV